MAIKKNLVMVQLIKNNIHVPYKGGTKMTDKEIIKYNKELLSGFLKTIREVTAITSFRVDIYNKDSWDIRVSLDFSQDYLSELRLDGLLAMPSDLESIQKDLFDLGLVRGQCYTIQKDGTWYPRG